MLGQNPAQPLHGNRLERETTPGNKLVFVGESNYLNATLELEPIGDVNNFDFGRFGITLTYSQDNNVFPWESMVAWQYTHFYIDPPLGPGFGNDGYLFRHGANVSGTGAALRKKMLIDIYQHQYYVPDLIFTSATHYSSIFCRNHDSTAHDVGLSSVWKYIITGGSNG